MWDIIIVSPHPTCRRCYNKCTAISFGVHSVTVLCISFIYRYHNFCERMRINHLINVVYTAHYLSMYKGNIWCIVDFGHAKIAAVGIPRGPSCALKETLTPILANWYIVTMDWRHSHVEPSIRHAKISAIGIPRGPSCAIILALFQFFMAKPVLVHLQFSKVGSAPIVSSYVDVALVHGPLELGYFPFNIQILNDDPCIIVDQTI